MNGTPSPINSELQRELLLLLRSAYPQSLYGPPEIPGLSWNEIAANLSYLEEHGLCQSGLIDDPDGGDFLFSQARITAAGLDFLEEDGGLTAILNTVTVKLHADTLRDMLSAKITAEEKSTLRGLIGRLSGKALEAITTDLVRAGIQQIPNFAEWIHKMGVL